MGNLGEALNEHEGWVCDTCDSTWIRYEHLDGKDCDENCDTPCVLRCCNEEDCGGGASNTNVECTRCGTGVEETSLMRLGDALICEICWDDL